MTFDALALHAVRNELDGLVGGRFQQVLLLGPHDLGLEIYAQHRRQQLYISTEGEQARVHLVSTPLKRTTQAITPFLLLLRKHVRDGRLEWVQQPRLERTISLGVAKRDDDGQVRRVRLIIEAMGRRSNAILVDEDGSIHDALKRLSPSRNPRRPLLPHLHYTPPPAQDRLDPLADATVARLRDEALQKKAMRLVDLLATRLAGCSPQTARELVWRAAGSVQAEADEATDWVFLRQAIEAVFGGIETGEWRPVVARQAGAAVAFAPYPLTQVPGAELQPMESMSAAVECFYASASRSEFRTPSGGGAQTRNPEPEMRNLLDRLDTRRRQLERKREALERSLAEADRAEELRAAGEAILASVSEVAEGQDLLTWEGRSIPLDPTLGPVENSQRYFKEYRKARDAARQVPDLLQAVERELDYLAEMDGFLRRARSPAEVRALRSELESDGGLGRPGERATGRAGDGGRGRTTGKKRPAAVASRPARFQTDDGFEIVVGTSARTNEEVTFKLAHAEDVWLHARGVRGAHVVIRTQGRDVPRVTLERAAGLAARHSAAAGSTKVAVDWTKRRNVRRQRGAMPGQVIYTQEQTVIVTPLE